MSKRRDGCLNRISLLEPNWLVSKCNRKIIRGRRASNNDRCSVFSRSEFHSLLSATSCCPSNACPGIGWMGIDFGKD